MPSVSNPFLTSKNDSAAASQPHPSDRDDQVEKHAAWHRHVADTCRRESDRFGAAFTAGTAALCLAGNYFLHGYSPAYRNRVEITGKVLAGSLICYFAFYGSSYYKYNRCVERGFHPPPRPVRAFDMKQGSVLPQASIWGKK